MKFIVTAGGEGTKVWPLSRKDKPKQFQNIIGNESLFSYNVNTLLKKFSPNDIYISTKRKYIPFVLEQAPIISIKNYIIEPDISKNRGPAEGLAFLTLSIKHPNEPCFIVQSDCLRIPEDKFLDMISLSEKLVKKYKKFITAGAFPEYPIMGIDYIKIDGIVEKYKNINVYKAVNFLKRVKNYKETKKLISNKSVMLHANHFCWYPNLILKEYKKYKPDWFNGLMQIKKYINTKREEEMINQIYENFEPGATEEVTSHLFKDSFIIEMPFKWVDVGTWDSLYQHVSGENNLYTEGKVIAIDSEGSLVKSQNPQKLITILGVKDMVVVDTEDILLIVPREKAGEIKNLQNQLKSQNLDEYL